MSDNHFKFYNYPKSISIDEYNACYEQVLAYLVENYRDCSIYRAGGNWIQPGISDIDFLIVYSESIDGNKLYLREFPGKPRRLKVLVHEPFAVDSHTFQWINRLTTYNLKEVHQGKIKINLSDTLVDQPIYKLIKLVMYIVVNYPMNFYSPLTMKEVDVRRSLSKLKKLLQLDELFKQVFEGQSFLNPDFAREIIDFNNDFPQMTRIQIDKGMLGLIQKGNKTIDVLFELFERESNSQFGLDLSPTSLTVGPNTAVFTPDWRTGNSNSRVYQLPVNLSLINQLLSSIDGIYLQDMSVGKTTSIMPEISELGKVWGSYLDKCNENKILMLITDMNFSVFGHNSHKYILFSYLGKIKRSILNYFDKAL